MEKKDKKTLESWLYHYAEIGVNMVVAFNHALDRRISIDGIKKLFINNEYVEINILALDDNHIIFEKEFTIFETGKEVIILKAL